MSLSAKENDHARSIKEDMDLQEVEFVVYIDWFEVRVMVDPCYRTQNIKKRKEDKKPEDY